MSNLTLTEIRWLIFANFDDQISNSQILLRLSYKEQVLEEQSSMTCGAKVIGLMRPI